MAEHQSLLTYDRVLREILEDIMNVRLDGNQWLQATLPVKHGGLGIRSAVDVSLPAFISSCIQSGDLSHEISGIDGFVGLSSAKTLWLSRSGVTVVPDSGSQGVWDLPLIEHAKKSLIDSAVDDGGRARILAVTSPMSGDWLHALPIPSLGLLLSSQELRIVVSLRVGAKLVQPHVCVSCGDQVSERGAHGLSCRSSSGRLPRHTAANDLIKKALASAGVPSVLEPVGLTRVDGRRPDGLTMVPWSRGRCLVWDFTCSDTLARSHVQRCALEPASAANAAEERKINHYSDLTSDYIFAPIAVETLGPMGQVSTRFVRDLSKRLITASGDKRAGQYFRQRLGMAVQRGNALAVMGTLDEGMGLMDDKELDGITAAETDSV